MKMIYLIFILLVNISYGVTGFFSSTSGNKINSFSVTEGSTSFSVDFNVSLDTNTSEANLTCEFIDISTNGSDFVHSSLPINFNIGEQHKSSSFQINGDSIYEDNETFTMRLKDSSNNLLHEINATLVNDDSYPLISISNTNIGECNTSTISHTFSFQIQNQTDKNISFNISSVDDSAIGGSDFSSTNKTFSIETTDWSSNTLSKDLNITIICDEIYESNESFKLKVSSLQNVATNTSEAIVTIVDDEPIPTVTVSSSANYQSEDSGNDIKFTFNLSPKSKFDTNIALDINQTFTDSFLIATESKDYTISTKSINIPSNTNQAETTISIIDDTYYEFNETIRLNLKLTSGEANLTEYIEANISQDSDPELIVSQSLKDGTDLTNIFVTDMVEFNVSVKNNSEYNMSNVRVWNDLSISFEKNTTTLSSGTFSTYKVVGQANGYMFDIDSLKKDEEKYLLIDVNITEPPKVFDLTDSTLTYTKESDLTNLHSTLQLDDIFRVSDFSNTISVDTNFTEPNINIEYTNYTKNSFVANLPTFKAKQYLMDIEVTKETNLTKTTLELSDSVSFTIDITNKYTLPNKIANGLLLSDTISDALILPSSIDGIPNQYGYYIVDLENTNSKSLKFTTTPKQSGNIAGIYDKRINCAGIVTTYNKRFFDFNLTNNVSCVDLNSSDGFLIKGQNRDKITINGYEFDECNFNSSGSTSHPHVSTSIKNATLSTGKVGLNDGMGGKYCFGAKIEPSTYIEVNDVLNEGNGTFDTIKQLTITNWFYPTNLTNANDERVILSRKDSYYLTVTETGTNDDKLNFYIHKNNFTTDVMNLIDLMVPSGSSNYLSKVGDYYNFRFDTTINPNSWYYLGFFYDGNVSSTLMDEIAKYDFSDPSTFPDCKNDPFFCVAGGSNNILIRFCNKNHIGEPISQKSYFHRNLDNFTNQLGSGHAPLFCGTESGYGGDTMQLYLVQENGTLAPSSNPFAHFLPKEIISNTEDLYVYRDYDSKSGVTGYAENVEIYYNESNTSIIIDNFNKDTNTSHPNYRSDDNKNECRLCGASNPRDYISVFETNVTGGSTIIGDSILASSSSLTKNDSAEMSIDTSANASEDDLTIAQRLEITADSEILFAKLYWQGAILFDTTKRYIKEKFSPDRFLDQYKNISFYKDGSLITLDKNDMNCSWFRPAKYLYQKAKPVTYDCTGNKWYSPSGDTSATSRDRVCLDELIKIGATDARGNARLMGLEEALYYQCSIDVTDKVAPSATYKVTDILTTTSSANAYSSVGGTFGGWALAVAYDNNGEKFKRIKIFDGFRALSNSDRIKDNFTFTYPFSVGDFQTPKNINDMNMSLLLFASEGDKTHLGDEISIDFRYGNSYTNYYASDKLDSTLDEIFSNSYLGVDIDNIPITVTNNNYLIESNISLNIKVSEDVTEADNYFLGTLGFNANLDERNCYEQNMRIYKSDGTTILPSSSAYIDGNSAKFSTYELRKGDTIYLKVTAKNEGFYSNYLSINTLIENNSSLEFLCIANDTGNCIDNNDSQHILSDNNLTVRVGNNKSLNSGGLLLNKEKGIFYVKAKVIDYKNGHKYEINHDQYRYRDDNITTLKSISKCSSNADYNLNFEDLDLTLQAWFSPNQVFPAENSKLTIRVRNNSSFDAEDLNLTVAFTNLSSYFGINDLTDINNSITTPTGWSYMGYDNSGDKTIIYFKADENLTPSSSYTYFYIDIKAPNIGGTLKTTSTLNSPMIVDSPKTKNTNLSIIDLKAEYRFDECYLGSRGDGSSMVVVDNARGDYNATAYDSNTTDTITKICRVGDFSKNSTSDYILLNKDILNGKNSFSISLWLKTNSTNQQAILSGANSSDNNEVLMFINGNQLQIYTSESTLSFSTNLRDGNWHHVVWVRSGKNNWVYIDGNKLNSTAKKSSSNKQVDISSGGLMLGQEQDSVGGGFSIDQDFEGYLDEVKFFDTVLNATTIQRIYNNESSGRDASNDTTTRSCQICYPNKYSFISDGKGICGDRSGEDVNLTLLSSDNSEFKFISPSDSIVDYNSIYPTLAYFDLNISSGVNESNITFNGSSYNLASSIRVDGNETFKFYNPCKNGSGAKCSDSTTVNFNVENVLQSPVIQKGSIANSGMLDFTLIDRVINVKRNGISYGSYPKAYDTALKMMDNLAQNYNFYMEFNESESGKAITISDSKVTDSVNYYNLIESGFDTASTLVDSVATKKNITFTTPSDKLGLSSATITVANSENFCVDGTYGIEVLTKPDSFKLDLDSKVLYLMENYQFLTETTLKYDDNLTLKIEPICSGATCSNNLKNLNNFMGSDVTTYFSEIKSRVKNSSTTVNIEINGSSASDHNTEWGIDGNFTKLYFNSNSLDSAIAYSDRNNQLVDLNFTISYFKLFNRDGTFGSHSAYGSTVYGGGIPAKYIKGPDHLRATLTCDNKCGSSCSITIAPEGEDNSSVEWSDHKIGLNYTINKGVVNGVLATNSDNRVLTPAGSAPFTFNFNTVTSTCCTNSKITIDNILLIDPNDNTVNGFYIADKVDKIYYNLLDEISYSKDISFDCPAYSFMAIDGSKTIGEVINSCPIATFPNYDIRRLDANISTKIANNNFDLTLIAYWDENGTFIDFHTRLKTTLIDKHNADSVVSTSTPNPIDLGNIVNNTGYGLWSNINLGTDAYRYLRVKMVEDGNDTHFDDSDPFAIRPNNFTIDIIPGTNPNSARAGESFNIDFSVQDNATPRNTINNYIEREDVNRSFTIDSNLTYPLTLVNAIFGNWDYAESGNLQFANGQKSNVESNFSEVGVFDINITDGDGSYENNPTNCSACATGASCISSGNTCPFACIDIVDSSCTGLSVIDSATDRITITPFAYRLKTSPTFSSNDWYYMGGIKDDNYAEVNATIEAINALTQPTKNFRRTIFDGNIAPLINVNSEFGFNRNNPTPSSRFSVDMNYSYAKNTLYNGMNFTFDDNLSSLDDFNTTFISADSLDFYSNELNLTLRFNVYRNHNIAINPIQFNSLDINTTNSENGSTSFGSVGVTDGENFGGSGNKNMAFYYGRVWAGNYETVESSQDVNITSEIYCANCENFIVGLKGDENDIYVYWFKNRLDNFTPIWNIIKTSSGMPNLTISNTTPNINDNITITRGADYGKAEFNISTPNYMWFDKNRILINSDPKFDVTFRDASNPNAITKRRIDW